MTSAKRVLLIGDETGLRRSLAEQVRLHGEFAVEEAATVTEILESSDQAQFNVVLITVGRPDQDGQELSRTLRRVGIRCPMILLTAAGATVGLDPDSGVSECLSKPFRLGALMARIRTLVERFEKNGEVEATIGPYRFRSAARLLSTIEGGRTVRLTEKETEILGYLLGAGNVVTGRETLLAAVWGYNAGVTTHTLETHVYRLRRKIENDPVNARILITEPGGYRLVP